MPDSVEGAGALFVSGPRMPEVWVYGDTDPLPATLVQANNWFMRGLIRMELDGQGKKRWILTPRGHRILAEGAQVAQRHGLTL